MHLNEFQLSFPEWKRKKRFWHGSKKICRGPTTTSQQMGYPLVKRPDNTTYQGRHYRTEYNEEYQSSVIFNYTSYMHEHIFPISKMQVMGLAREIDKAKGSENRVFSENGPSNKWWRGFKSRKPEAVDRGRIHNATKDNIDDFFNKSTSIIHKIIHALSLSTTATRLLST